MLDLRSGLWQRQGGRADGNTKRLPSPIEDILHEGTGTQDLAEELAAENRRINGDYFDGATVRGACSTPLEALN